ncbi:helix-turn-helix domain-containing protein [Aureimonas jatrophae]|uniref:Zn-dependent peptidase ImmA, M78 family n=1 Tax=Aureimonas jatrophae TaxID=1166073 RepID=A0A1H0IU07_9HYPH|nr:XRE family transcriptional regulator [Aureimonas jatrophae]MBB3952361.1 transcriptional regulator with XRE-family HTH domain [Aureimonas jatrophae]SDO34852.1 Zn-dependent peptidase ImmA, M78 family [Aureimonas jatrophae]
MIATEHQFNITSKKLDKLNLALGSLRHSDRSGQFHERQIRSLEETVEELEAEIREYEALKAGEVPEIVVQSLADLPTALIKARIARGFSQSNLASALGMRPQQIQRWEAEGYASAAFTVLARVAEALRLDINHRLPLADRPFADPKRLRKALVEKGLPAKVVDRRIMPKKSRASLPDQVVDEVDARLRKLLGFGLRSLAASKGFEPAAMQFKLPASADQERTRAYAAYLEGICGIVAKTVRTPPSPLPDTISDMHAALFADGISLRGAAVACWSMGIGVIALDDSLNFDGACWRRGGRSVVVLRNRGGDEARALFDLIHEVYHLAATKADLGVIEAEETSSDRRESTDERRANRFAAEVLTDGRLAELLARVVERSESRSEQLKSAVRQVAAEADVPVGIMANLFAGNLDKDGGRNWWASAKSMQPAGGDPWRVVRDVFVRNADFSRLDRIELDLLDQILESVDE